MSVTSFGAEKRFHVSDMTKKLYEEDSYNLRDDASQGERGIALYLPANLYVTDIDLQADDAICTVVDVKKTTFKGKEALRVRVEVLEIETDAGSCVFDVNLSNDKSVKLELYEVGT